MTKRITRRYLVSYHLVGEQTAWVTASSAKEAKKKAVNGEGVDAVDFNVLYPQPSTAEIVSIEEVTK